MENLLQNIPYVIVRVDDILVSGACDEDHSNNLEEVLKRLESAGLRLRKNKCVFMEPQVTYLGHKASKEVFNHWMTRSKRSLMHQRPRMCRSSNRA